ncbi:MAG: glutamate--tRNA ligase, partial [Patescibacteria group bacterium]
SRKEPPGYDGHCKTLTGDEVNKRLGSGEAATIRIKWQRTDEKISFNDHLHGLVSFPAKTIQDAILLKSDGFPTYHLANVVDDHEMGVTHVIRGEEWLPSAPLHGLLYTYLHYAEPEFYHVPLILNPDKSKLSKRQGDVAVEDYLAKGYLKEALINYVAFLGWNPGDEREIFSLDELTHAFELSHIHKAGAIFNIEKLNWFNSWYIKNALAVEKKKQLADALERFLPESNEEQRITIFNMFYERVNALSELEPMSRFLRELPSYEASLLVFKKSSPEMTLAGLIGAGDSIKSFDVEWTAITIELAFKKIMTERSLAPGDIFWPVRVALTGQQASPPPTEVAAVLGREETLARIDSAIQKLKKQ